MPANEPGRTGAVRGRNEAHIIVGRLESEGIPAVAFDTGMSIMEGRWLLIPIRVMVDEDDIDEGRGILAG